MKKDEAQGILFIILGILFYGAMIFQAGVELKDLKDERAGTWGVSTWVSCGLVALAIISLTILLSLSAKSGWRAKRHLTVLQIGIALSLLCGVVGVVGVGWIAPHLDFSFEYAQLIGRYRGLASFEPSLQDLSTYHISGRLVLCKEDGGLYSLGKPLPKDLRSYHSTDVRYILFVRSEHLRIPGYYSDGSTGVEVHLAVCVIDVASATVIGVFHAIGRPDGMITSHFPGVDLGSRDGSEDGAEHLFDWITSRTG